MKQIDFKPVDAARVWRGPELAEREAAWTYRLNAEDINIDGDGFVTPTSSHGPEEFVPGQVLDTLDIQVYDCLLYTSPSPRDQRGSRMPSSA